MKLWMTLYIYVLIVLFVLDTDGEIFKCRKRN